MDLETFMRVANYINEASIRDSAQFIPPNKTNGAVNVQPVFTRTTIRKLYLACHINPEDFLLTKDKEEAYWKEKLYKSGADEKTIEKKKKLYFTNDYWETLKPFFSQNPIVQVKEIPVVKPKISSNPGLTEIYDDIANKYFRNAKKSIEVHEILFKGNNNLKEPNLAYMQAQNIIFSAIKDVLAEHKKKGTDFNYTRVLCLSPESLHPRESKPEMLKAMTIETSAETLGHIVECLEDYPKLCNFYLAPPSRFRHSCLIDGNIMLTEDYIIQHNYIHPHRLHIDNLSYKSDLQKTKEDFELGETEKKALHKLKKSNISSYLDEALEYLEDQKILKNKIIDLIDKNLRPKNNAVGRWLRSEKEIFEALENQKNHLDLKLSKIKKRKITPPIDK